MKLIYKILLFSVLSFSLPVGKLFDIFLWSIRIVKTETVHLSADKKPAKIFYLFKQFKKTAILNSTHHFYYGQDLNCIECFCDISLQNIFHVQDGKTLDFIKLLIKRNVFNVIYDDHLRDTVS